MGRQGIEIDEPGTREKAEGPGFGSEVGIEVGSESASAGSEVGIAVELSEVESIAEGREGCTAEESKRLDVEAMTLKRRRGLLVPRQA